jgi:hypothetical protein
MKKYIYLLAIGIMLGTTGCGLVDDAEERLKDAADTVVGQVKSKYEEYRGDGEENTPKPFTVVFQDDPNAKTSIISSNCDYNQPIAYVYYETPADTNRVLYDTQNLISNPGYTQKPFWDIRYVDPVSKYMDGGDYSYYPDHSTYTGLDTRSGVNNVAIGTDASKSDVSGGITQSECVNGLLAGGTTINLNNAPEQAIYYGGPQSTFTYQLSSNTLSSPWHADGTGNLALQATFNRLLYFNHESNIGGGVNFGLFLKNKRNGKVLNYVIALYAIGDAWIQENRGIQFDPTTQFVHVSTVSSDNSWWSTKSPASLPITEITRASSAGRSDNGQWNDLFRVNIAYQNLEALLSELAQNPPAGAENQDFGQNPADWEIKSINIQYELEEEGGKASLSGSFRGFEAYMTQLPI